VERIDHSSKCAIDMSEVCNRTCYHEVFSFGWIREHRIQERSRICPSILTIRIATTFTIVPDLIGKTKVSKGVCDDHRCTATTREEPDTTSRIEDTEFETCTRLTIEFFYIFFSFDFLRAKRMRKRESYPVLALAELLTIIDSSNHIETDY
jgi:hypothetical protein